MTLPPQFKQFSLSFHDALTVLENRMLAWLFSGLLVLLYGKSLVPNWTWALVLTCRCCGRSLKTGSMSTST